MTELPNSTTHNSTTHNSTTHNSTNRYEPHWWTTGRWTALVVGILFISPAFLAAGESPRKALVQVTRNLAQMASESGYRTDVAIIGGISSASDHSIEIPKYLRRVQASVRGKLMHLSEHSAYLYGGKVAIEEEGVWMKPGTSDLGREIAGMFEVPTDLLMNALKRGSRVEWVANRIGTRKAIRVVLPASQSRARFSGIEKSGCVAAEGRRLSYFQSRLERSNTQTTIIVDLDPAGELPQKIQIEVLGAYRDDNGRSRKGQLAFEEGTNHAAFHFIYWLDTSAAVGQFKVPQKAQRLLK